MRLTTLTDYAMRLLMYVGQHPDRLCTIAEIASAYNISEPHLMKVTHRLSVKGWLTTVRGKNGGMKLAKAPSQINLGAVVRDTENDFQVVECLGPDSTCALGGNCALTEIMASALQQFLRHLDHYTLADILPASEKTIMLMQSDHIES
ncbi:MAG TPA: Rrf2 family transcriptional regulator [Pusillimonas sp.]|nr:Rrf2 family transcriptional regulator [Pusillimonas sp.]|tara:strand:- start:2510 stop:2953 length:444 start_codon:yes stop_codon:yes gene_type:complete